MDERGGMRSLAKHNASLMMDAVEREKENDRLRAELSEKSGLLKPQAEEIAALKKVADVAREVLLSHATRPPNGRSVPTSVLVRLRAALARLDAAPTEAKP